MSYLAPSIPERLFEILVERISSRVGVEATLEFERSVSGPTPDNDPFASGRADLAFVCAPSYALLKAAGSPVALLPAAPVFADPRAQGRPVYYGDVVVRRDHPTGKFEDLRGAAWAYNDRQSRSGWQSMLARLLELGHSGPPTAFFRDLVHSGSHLRSLDLVASGEADAAAIDSNTLWLRRRKDPGLADRLRVLESWGPFPIQPVLARKSLFASLGGPIADALLTAASAPGLSGRLAEFGLLRFSPVSEVHYDSLQPPF